MYIPLTAGVGINNAGGVVGSPNLIQNINAHTTVASGTVDIFVSNESYYPGSFNLGPGGTPVTTTGRVLYNADLAGSGYLRDILLVNRNGVSFYFGINTSGINIQAGTILASGESVLLEHENIRNLWAIASTGVVNVYGHGSYNRLMNTI